MYNNNYSKYEQILKHMKNIILILLSTFFTLSCQQEAELHQDDRSIIHDYRDYVTNESVIKLEKIELTNTFDNPWSMEFINDEMVVITEKEGGLSLVNLNTYKVSQIKHTIPLISYGQGGLLDITYYKDNLYISFTMKNNQDKYTTAIGKGEFVPPYNEINNFEILLEALPYLDSSKHFGSRLLIQEDNIYATIGERGNGELSQNPGNHIGSVVEINLNQTEASDRFDEYPDSLSEVYQIGLRNPQGLALSTNGSMYLSNHGAKGGDFIGLVLPGTNYGWNNIGWGGTNYIGTKIGNGEAFRDEYLKPIVSWVPSIAPSDIVFYKGDEFPEWSNDLLVTSLKFKMLLKISINNGNVSNETIILKDKIGRIRDVDINSKGEIFLICDEANSTIWRITNP